MTSLYVHIPFCESKCRYCAFYSEDVSKHDTASLVNALIAQINQYDFPGPLKTVYIGGGSPSCLPPSELFWLIDSISNRWPAVTEFTVEVNPGQVDGGLLEGLFVRGVNRLSIGAQSFNNNELKFLSRRHNADDISLAFKAARRAGFGNISIDLIFAICGSDLDSFRYSLDKALSLAPEHISAYSLTIEPDTWIGKACSSGQIEAVDEETDRAMYEFAIDKLNEAGYQQYEISNFALSGFQCAHNLACWANDEYVGIGPAAGSWYGGVRYTNVADIAKYIEATQTGKSVIGQSHRPDAIEIACETAVLNLRRLSGICFDQFKAKTGFDAKELFAEPISSHLKHGLLQIWQDQQRISLTRKALPIADSVLCDFSSI